MSCGEYDRVGPLYPLRKWVSSQDVGLPPFLETGDSRWIKKGLAAWSWLGCLSAPLFVPYISEPMPHSGQKVSKWRVSMDVSHFSPSEISVSVRDGFLEVGGKHEERPDEHGFISRCFTRKYRLPAQVNVTKLESSLSIDGFLTVEAPLPEASAPAAIVIPIKASAMTAAMPPLASRLRLRQTGSPPYNQPGSNACSDKGSSSSLQPPSHPQESNVEAEPEIKQEGQEEESQLEACSDQVQPSSTTAGLEQEDKETREKPAGQSHSSLPEEDKCFESIQKSSEHHKVPESQESLGTSNLLEHKEPVVDEEIQVKAEGAGELAPPVEQELGSAPLSDVQSQELEAANIEQQHTD